ncbi:MAG: NUDIX hydrolase [Bacteroidetes bacterium]|nr:NUDIX hydrolase [Bacteroidota bacterium]MCL5737849.1 NUDIX hydrolase [Bacteroidota bacterium]
MALKKLKTLDTKSIYKNPYWEYKLDSYTLPDGKVGEYHYVHTPGAVMVVPVADDGRLILVKQFRYLWKKESIEFPAGGVKGGNFLLTAKNELEEEAEVAAANWELAGEFNPFNGVADEVCKVYFATELSPAAKEKDSSEEFEILKMTSLEFQSMVEKGEIWDGMTLAAWALAKRTVLNHLKEIGK